MDKVKAYDRVTVPRELTCYSLLLLLLEPFPLSCGVAAADSNSPPTSSVIDFIICCSGGSHVSVDTVHQSLLRSSPFSSPRRYHLQSLSSDSDVFVVSPISMSKPHFLHLWYSLPSVSPWCYRFSHVLLVCGRMPGPSAHNFCHFQFLHVGARNWHCLHPVQQSWLNGHLVDLSFNITLWWYSLIA